MLDHTLLISTWADGLFCLTNGDVRQEIADQPVRGMARDGRGGVLAIVGGRSVHRRTPEGQWHVVATGEIDLSCCLVVGNDLIVGTDDARLLRADADGALIPLSGFDAVEDRADWYAGTALVDGVLRGPPLGVRSMAATCDGTVWLANVHVGGIPRSTNQGAVWRPTIEVDSDVHEVCAHASRPDLVVAAAAVGLCVSRDAGATWTIETDGLHAPHCSAVAFIGDTILVSASEDPFSERGAVYRRDVDAAGSLQPVGGGLPRWLAGVPDTQCISAHGRQAAVIDGSGRLYLSHDEAATWSQPIDRLIPASGVILL